MHLSLFYSSHINIFPHNLNQFWYFFASSNTLTMEESDIVYENSHLTNASFNNTSQPLDSFWLSNSSPSFHGSSSMANYEVENNNTQMPIVRKIETKQDNNNEDFNGSFYQPEKKRRLSQDQVQFLEKSFEIENKLEPYRKIRLAKELGLHPRQVTIWFQNRRARYRTKNLENEYGCLKVSYETLEHDFDTLYKDNEKLKNQVQLLKDKLLQGEKGKPPISESNDELLVGWKPENVSNSTKSDVYDSYSPHCADGALIEPADSSRVIETEASDFSQDEDDNLSKSLVPPSLFPKLEIECFDDLQPNSCSFAFDDLQPNSCNFAFPVQDQGTWYWQY